MSPEAWSAFAAWVVAISAGGAATAAFLGLSTWRSQLVFQTDHDLARRLLVEVYKFRDAVAAARSPFIWASEMRSEPEESGSSLQTSKESHEGLVRAHQRRLNEFGVIRPQLYALLLEAEAVWGADLSKLWRGLDRLQGELISQTQLYLEFSDPENSSAPETAYYASKEARAAGEKIVYSNGEAEGQNDFSNRFLAAFSRVEDYLRAKLGRSVK